ncbi:ribosome silencing factor [Candidatus Venteria ishoeyi]|uniref:Ribosomal silencing factor RsfS n=1 Tax=Candidatus Venteria ishoeyi TaxID=1899563 RepID=A0A1H6FA85_9GAMM|nr:ribosome silencing factor [Candidatus Venteria ishoeyi]MDM8545018.1 ribosome silencing factor [Candidatus Venteria ishoeyi]SEH07007.1 Ribosomal silencing factor RsfS [Candidatus Venteria ishoeyi]
MSDITTLTSAVSPLAATQLSTEQLRDLVIDAMEDLKAQDISVLDVRAISDVTDIMIIASGASNRQVAAIANNVVEKAKAQGQQPVGTEGENNSEWVLVDLGDVIAHVMQPEVRAFYQLEKLWETAPEQVVNELASR